jgi:hypothetical protein
MKGRGKRKMKGKQVANGVIVEDASNVEVQVEMEASTNVDADTIKPTDDDVNGSSSRISIEDASPDKKLKRMELFQGEHPFRKK